MGLFSKKPSRAEQAKFVAVSQKVMPVFMHLAVKGRITFSDDQTVDLDESDQSIRLREAIMDHIAVLQLKETPPYSTDSLVDRAKRIHDLSHATSYEEIGPISEASLAIIGGLNAHEMLCFNYYEFYPSFEPLREMIDSGVKVMGESMSRLYGDSLPDDLRLSFPRFGEHFVKIADS